MFATCSRLSNPARNTHVPAPVREFGKTCDVRGRMLSSAWDAFDCLRGKNPPRRVSNVRATFSRHLQELFSLLYRRLCHAIGLWVVWASASIEPEGFGKHLKFFRIVLWPVV